MSEIIEQICYNCGRINQFDAEKYKTWPKRFAAECICGYVMLVRNKPKKAADETQT